MALSKSGYRILVKSNGSRTDLIQRLGKEIEKNGIVKGFLIGGATAIGTVGAVYISTKTRKKKTKQGKS
ncbi:MAG: hypothetical protein ACYDG2_23385, partial [Ruminiclostridium sp.]